MQKPDKPQANEPNFCLTDVTAPCILFFYLGLLHTTFYIFFETYTTGLWLMVVPTLGILSWLFYIEKYAPTLTAIGAHAICGGWGPIASLILPEFIVFTYSAHFIGFMCVMFLESNRHALTSLLGSNLAGWLIFCIYLLCGRSNDRNLVSDTDCLFQNSRNLAQMVLGVAISYVIIYIVHIEKRRLAFLETKYKNELLALNDDLKKANVNLEQSNKSMQEALSERESFILRFSHEIRNPLNSLLGNVEICQDSVVRLDEREMLRDAKMSGEILLQLLNNVLDSAKILAKRLEVDIQSHNFRDFTENLWVTCSEMIKKEKLFGSIAVNMNVPKYVEFDELRLKQIFMNLISNSTKFTQKGFVNIFIDFLEVQEYSPFDLKPKYTGVLTPESTHLIDANNTEDPFLQENPLYKHESLTLSSLKFRNKTHKYFTKREEQKIDLQVQNHQTRPLKSFIRSPDNLSSFASDSFISNTRNKKSSLAVSAPVRQMEGYLRIEIVDSGCGINEEILKNVFKKYDQLNSVSSSRRIGTGLGLWITKELVELMNGSIEIYSKPKVGTCLVIMLKAKSGSHLSSSDGARNKSLLTNVNLQPIAKRVLVVEDIAYNQEVNRRFLEKCQVEEITIASNGLEALELYQAKGERYFDAIFTDLDMPIMDGKTATKLIREHETKLHWKPVKIIILTGYSESGTQQELLDPAGPYRADFFLSKPSSFATFMKVLKTTQKNTESSKKVVLVDFDTYDVDVITKMFSRCGLKQVDNVSSADIFKYYQSNQNNIQLILMDCESIWKPGLSIVKKIRKYQTERQLGRFAIFGATCKVEENHSKKCIENELDGILNKPLTLNDLRSLLQHRSSFSSGVNIFS